MSISTRASSLALLWVLGACPGDGGTELTVSARGAALIAVRQDGAWEPLDLDADGRASFTPTGPFELVRTCAETRWTKVIAAGPDVSSDALASDCVRPVGAAVVTVTVSGASQATVSIGDNGMALPTGQSAVALAVAPGTYDIVVLDDQLRRIIIERDVVITGDTGVTVDLATDGVALTQRAIEGAFDGLRWGQLKTTRGTRAFLSADFDQASLWLPPASALATGDVVYAIENVGNSERGTFTKQAIDPAAVNSIALPPPEPIMTFEPSPLDLGGWSARWTVDGAWEWARFVIAYRVTQPSVSWDLNWHLGSRPLEPAGEVVMPAFAEIPGWDTSWSMPSNGLSWGIAVERGDPRGAYEQAWAQLSTP
jgi:hypothetical protein